MHTEVGPVVLMTTESFATFAGREYGPVLALVVAVHGRRDAEDIVQEAFIRAQSRWDGLAESGWAALWVRRVALNLAVSRFRRWKVESAALRRLGSRRDEPVGAMSAPAEEIWAEVRRLSARQAQVIALRYLEDRRIAEIAALLGLAEGTVRALLHQGRQRLARRLGETLGEGLEEYL